MIAADLFARQNNDYGLQLASAALDEIVKFIGDGDDIVPEAAITSRAGWAAYGQEPGRFRVDRLRAVRDHYRK